MTRLDFESRRFSTDAQCRFPPTRRARHRERGVTCCALLVALVVLSACGKTDSDLVCDLDDRWAEVLYDVEGTVIESECGGYLAIGSGFRTVTEAAPPHEKAPLPFMVTGCEVLDETVSTDLCTVEQELVCSHTLNHWLVTLTQVTEDGSRLEGEIHGEGTLVGVDCRATWELVYTWRDP